MITIRRADERGRANHGWLDTKHTFSFASYHDPNQMGFRSLRVINEDRVTPGRGFGTHEHRNMEIVSYVLEGALEHQDSAGNKGVLKPGEFQRISAGRGIQHSELNPSKENLVHFYQIWILPDVLDIAPSYEQKRFHDSKADKSLRLVASPRGEEGSLSIHQDVRIYLSLLDLGHSIRFPILPGRHVWVQVLRGFVTVNGYAMAFGDGAAISEELLVDLLADKDAEILLFDLP